MAIPRTFLLSATLMFLYFPSPASSTMHSNLTDLASLLAFKSQLTGPGTLAGNWTSTTSFCVWLGVTCTPRMPHRVFALNLSGFSLQGTVSPYLSNLSFMSLLNLKNNSLHGSIPDTLSLLPRLNYLNFEYNQLSGPLPPSIFNISSLISVAFSYNNFSGYLPAILNHSILPRLKVFSVYSNQLIGDISSSFACCPRLHKLYLSFNQFSGTIPVSLPQGLSVLYISNNDLTGAIPATLTNLTSLIQLDLSFNRFIGGIPIELGHLPNVQGMWLNNNQLTGTIPTSFANSSMLSILELSKNKLVGAVPPDTFANMPHLTTMNLGRNQLTGTLDFLTPLTNNRALEDLEMIENKFQGLIPSSIGNFSNQMQVFSINSNLIEGRIPDGFGNLTNLMRLDLSENKLQGSIPSDITRLQFLQVLYVAYNNLDGYIPRELGQLRSLGQLYFSFNNFNGSIPDTLSNLSSLQELALARNSLTSNIPDSLWSLQLIALDLSQNLLTGTLEHLGSLELPLDLLDLSFNRLSGSIPNALGNNLNMLEYLDISHNSLLGYVPDSLSNLINVNVLNLSSNSLSGPIPKSLADLRYLVDLNLSFNRLEGQIPNQGVFQNITFQSLVGNLALCGIPRLGFPSCSSSNSTGHHSRLLHIVLPIVASMVLVVVAVAVVFLVSKWKKGVVNEAPIIVKQLADQRFISYQELIHATENFSEANLLGRGGFGSVFKGYLNDGMAVAVKVLNLQMEGASESFEAECRALCMVRHRNLVKIISTCSNLDFKALILPFMPNGSLESCLYSAENCLTLDQRMSIMMDVAFALEYLHDHHIVHCDLKPSNVLLDEEMTGHVGDFGIAKLMLIGNDHSKSSLISASAPGTIGYMAPEYGLAGRVSRKADVYSYGILLLETFTRRRPTDTMFNGDLSLRQWVYEAYPEAVFEIVDSELLTVSKDGDNSSSTEPQLQCLESLLELGLSCSEELSIHRTVMKEVTARLTKIRAGYLTSLAQPSLSLTSKHDKRPLLTEVKQPC